MVRKRLAILIVALIAGLGLQVAGAGAASASKLATFWDGTDWNGNSHYWTYGSSTWKCDAPWYGDGADVQTSYVGDGWNDRYSSGNTGDAACGMVIYQHANFTGIYQVIVKDPPRYFSLYNSEMNNQTSSITWS